MRHRKTLTIIISVICGLCLAVTVFFGIQFFTKTGVFRIPGVVYYDDSLTEDEKSFFQTIFTEEIDLDKDVTISAYNSTEKPAEKLNEFLAEIYVPTTDFYSSKSSISSEELTALASAPSSVTGVDLIAIEKLNSTQKLLSVDNNYYLDNFNNGAVFRTYVFESELFEKEIKPLVTEQLAKTFPDKSSVLTFAQTGVTALSRAMNKKLQSVEDATFFSAEIAGYLSGFDITHTSNESSFSDYATSDNICSKWEFRDTLLDIGLDIVELTGNHNQDCGDTAAKDSIAWYKEQGISIVGGGETAEAAAVPVKISQKSTNITFLAYNESTGGATKDATPGANQYYEENAVAEINAAKERGDFVIVDIQYYECSAYASEYEDPICDYADSAAGDQIGFFRHLIDLGADLVVGTSAHQPQTFELYNNGAIYYGLGNLFFDQVWWPGTTRSLVLSHYFYNGKLLQTKLVPTVYGKDMQTKLLDKETSEWFIQRLIDARPDPPAVGLQAEIESWVNNAGGNSSIVIYDLDNQTTLASHKTSETYGTASLYKLFVVYEGYRRLENGSWNADDFISSAGHTRLECLDLAIRESYSPCAEALWNEIGHENLDNIIKNDFKITNSDISNLESNAKDILKIMQLFYKHPDITNPEYIARMKDSFLNQPTTDYNWRQGLPSGFKTANVYNKVGWEYNASKKFWNIYHDTAIIEFPEQNRHFIIVAMTNKIDFSKIANLGTIVENYLLQNYL